ncbi:MAG: Coenzyme F420 hydrogenase/dehydrogenase, beta subunit C-terminal domain [Polymorphobacter sp.]|uniref:Coenzyme F420 hydrogenase/dehydrogenase, beta subunit C-terminal domain n=1 Tax=Polymorphobacter sp. TaxID=1909290 RepID=UPI003A83FCE5
MNETSRISMKVADGVEAPAVRAAAPRGLCTDCGVSRLKDPSACGTACQFIKPDYAATETMVHGRARDPQTEPDELFFGPFKAMWRARLKAPLAGAQWTGITSRLGQRLLEEGAVDAVLTMAPDPEDRWKPMPVIVTKAEGMAAVRGMRMGYAPLLAMLEPARDKGYKRIAVIGIPCQVHALRKIEADFGFERIYVIGTPCSDNTTTANFHEFLALLSDQPETISYLEFRADYKVELRFDDGRRKLVPFLMLPLSDLRTDFWPTTCRTCVDYTNALADITVGYMGGEGEQWLLVRNDRGAELLALLEGEVELSEVRSKGDRSGPVKGFMANTILAAGGLPLRKMPNWLRPIVGRIMPLVGPKGLEFGRARVEMKAIESVLFLRRLHGARMKNMIPPHVWRLAARYGLTPEDGETR